MCRTDQLHVTVQIVHNLPTVNVFYAVSKTKHEPFFFAEATVTCMAYLDMLAQWLLPQLKENFLEQLHFQQDRTLPHFYMAVMDFFDKNLSQAWTG
jgi:hypothetical protein